MIGFKVCMQCQSQVCLILECYTCLLTSLIEFEKSRDILVPIMKHFYERIESIKTKYRRSRMRGAREFSLMTFLNLDPYVRIEKRKRGI